MTLGSLFDGSGGFPLAGVINGIEPVWASEIEPYPLRVTAARFPQMKKLGDVTKINGAEIPKVDIITFGSPCQDLSVAGAQKGIHEGERSNLFFEAIRITKEMRAHDRAAGRADEHCRPRFAVWENVPGAFSSNKGADFQAVLQAFCGICDEAAVVPEPPKGKWANAGCIVGDGYSIAWRVYDAQYWGVPQRRKRIYLVADFAGERAGEILFEQESVRGDSAQGGETRQGTAEDAEGGSAGGRGVRGLKQVFCLQANGIDRADTAGCNGCGWRTDQSYTLNTIDRHAIVYDARGNGTGGVAPTLTGDHQNRVTDYTALVCAGFKAGQSMAGGIGWQEECAATLSAKCSGTEPTVCAKVFDQQRIGQYGNGETASTLMARDHKDAKDLVVEQRPPRRYIVRRLTPLECCRLQGFPDWWEDGAEGSDSARYKMWGNGIALPCADDVLRRIVKFAKEKGQNEQSNPCRDAEDPA